MKQTFRLAWLIFALGVTLPVMPVVFTGCKTSVQTIAYTTLATVGKTVNAAYSAYLDQVVIGKVSTNSVPAVSKAYNEFQAGFGLAVVAAQFNLTNSAPVNVQVLANNVIVQIQSAK